MKNQLRSCFNQKDREGIWTVTMRLERKEERPWKQGRWGMALSGCRDLKKGVSIIWQAWASQHTDVDHTRVRVREHWLGDWQRSILMELHNRQFRVRDCGSGRKRGLEKQVWELFSYSWLLKPWNLTRETVGKEVYCLCVSFPPCQTNRRGRS